MKKKNLYRGDKQSESIDQTSRQNTKKIMHKNKFFKWSSLFNEGRIGTIFMIFVLSIIVWYLIPIQLLVFYGEELKIDISLFNKISSIIFVFFTSVLILIYLFLYWITNKFIFKKSPLKFQRGANAVIIFAICWVTLSGYIFPLIKTTGGMVDEINIPTNWFNFVIVFIISGFITYFYHNKVAGKIILIIFLTFYLVTIPGGIINMVNLYAAKNDNIENLRKASQLSSHANLLVMSFDGLQGNIVDDIFINEPELQSEFKDFLYFDNVVSNAPATFSSIVTELFGNIDMRNFSDTEKGVLAKLPIDNLFMNMDVVKGVSVSTFGRYNFFNNRGLKLNNIAPKYILQRSNEILTLYSSEMSRLFTGKISGYFIIKVIRQPFKLLAIEDPYINHYGYNWDKSFLYHNRDYNTLIDNLHVGDVTDTLVIKYFHFVHTHWPVDFDKNGKYKSNDETWYKSNQNYMGFYNQTYYALSQFVDLINKLKELKVFDNTFLVLKSDHGLPTSYFNSYPFNLRFNEHVAFGYSRYRPMLMIKDIGREDSVMVNIPNLVSLGDLAHTISTRFKQDLDNSDFYPGLNLLEEIDSPLLPYIFMNIVKDSLSNYEYDNHVIIKIDRRISNSFLDLLKLQESVRLSTDSK